MRTGNADAEQRSGRPRMVCGKGAGVSLGTGSRFRPPVSAVHISQPLPVSPETAARVSGGSQHQIWETFGKRNWTSGWTDEGCDKPYELGCPSVRIQEGQIGRKGFCAKQKNRIFVQLVRFIRFHYTIKYSAISVLIRVLVTPQDNQNISGPVTTGRRSGFFFSSSPLRS